MKVDKVAEKLYETVPGRIALKVLTQPVLSKAGGRYLDSKVSRVHIKRFIKSNNIDMREYADPNYKTFNEFFTRKIRKQARPINYCPTNLIAPCDGRLLIYKINDNRFKVKGSEYTVSELLRNKKLASKFTNGVCLVFRLSVDNYHRYCYIDNGKKSRNVYIKGVLNTVLPVALERKDVFKENCREYTVMRTDNFDDVVQVEVGAMLVGKIKNYHEIAKISRGQEKGMFLYGGSTIILLFQEDIVNLNEDVINNSKNDKETPVKMGQVIGERIV